MCRFATSVSSSRNAIAVGLSSILGTLVPPFGARTTGRDSLATRRQLVFAGWCRGAGHRISGAAGTSRNVI